MWLLPLALPVQSAASLVSGSQLTRTQTIARGEYALASLGDKPALVIKGNNITVDCNRAIFRGTPATAEPDQRVGIGIEIIGQNVTVKNAIIRGYKVGIIARNAPGLRLINCDVSYNWKPRLLSTPEKEDEADWMSFHKNEKDEWLRYGAGIYLRGVTGFEIKGCRANGGGCGLMLTQCEKGLVWNNDFSYLSAIGVGMYRSSDNRIMHNRIDYCLRGFSYGVYNRGQDSAGILIYEQSNRNAFAYNSVTHGGDGFFLWAGQTTMDTGKGGCNDNLVYANDFSHAPTNGIEATFSRNRFINNLVLECWHGVWGGYSYDTKIIGNVFGYNTDGVAIEHGQKNEIAGNVFYRDDTAIHLWANAGSPDPNWGYPKQRNTKSHGYQIADNQFLGSAVSALNITRTADVWLDTNNFDGPNRLLIVGAEVAGVHGIMNSVSFIGSLDDVRDGRAAKIAGLTADEAALLSASYKAKSAVTSNGSVSALSRGETPDSEYFGRFRQAAVAWNPWETPAILRKKSMESDLRQASLIQLEDKDWVAPLKGGMNPFLPPSAKRGWRTMFVDEWGPVGTQSPKIVRVQDLAHSGLDSMDGVQHVRFSLQGPPGKFRVVSTKGLRVVGLPDGKVPGYLSAIVRRDQSGEVGIQLEFVGAASTDYRGITTLAGKPVPFGWSEFRSPITWSVSFYKWEEALNAIDPQRHPSNPFRDAPVYKTEVSTLDYATGGSFYEGGPANHFATVAEGNVTLPEGQFELNITADDGVRFYIDGVKVLDEWHYQGPTSYKIPIGAGTHKLRVEHFEIDGYAALKVSVKQK